MFYLLCFIPFVIILLIGYMLIDLPKETSHEGEEDDWI